VATGTTSALRRGIRLDNLGRHVFRANPEYEFVWFEGLSAEEKKLLGPLCGDPSYCGVLRARSATGLTAKAVCSETAKLFDLLKEPGHLPSAALRSSDSEFTISQFVFDGILEIACGVRWVSGPAACEVDAITPPEESGRILAELSLQALKHAGALVTTNALDLCSRLYRYNTLPLTPQWLQRIPDQSSLEAYLQIDAGGRCSRELNQEWTGVSPITENGAWLAWNSRRVPALGKRSISYKLYLSPLPAHLKESFRVWFSAITEAGAYHFKIGSDIRGMLRPDKMVAYFGQLSTLEKCARLITSELSDCPAQGVPFTVELDSGALLSWGSDPPFDELAPAWLQSQSWRQWICHRLGAALAVAKREKSATMPAWRFALERLRLEGVDVATWAPVSTSWRCNLAHEAMPS
jgi:hypothetical protein